MIRGRVTDRSNEALSGVTITIQGHPEYGQTLSRGDGMFDLAANGGGLLTIDYRKEGYLPVQRQIQAPWRDYVTAEDVVMIPADAQVTTIMANSPVMQVAQGSMQSDADGERQATVLFPAGTTATMILADGGQLPLNTLSVRATEYTVGDNGSQAMPGVLPATSGYTYAVELSVDEALMANATRVDFSQPLPLHVDNFLNFPTGEVVPTGYYDRERAAWIPSDNGRIVEILSIADDRAVLDVDGSGSPATQAQLDEMALSNDELVQLASLYNVGKTLWRVPISHFTPWDCNWPFGPPEDAEAPPDEPPETPDEDVPPPDKSDCKGGCIIEAQGQNLGEEIPLVGTPFTLNYRSNRMPGYVANRTINIPLSGQSVPASLQRIELLVHVAGRTVRQSFPATPNQSTTFLWDGRDAYKRVLSGGVKATITIQYIYRATYYSSPGAFEQSFALFGEADNAGNPRIIDERLTGTISIRKDYTNTLTFISPEVAIGGWTLSATHSYRPTGRALYLGTGNTRKNTTHQINNIIETVAGTGIVGFSGDGGPATAARLTSPGGVEVDSDGSIYIADSGNHRIRRVGPDGIITTVAGNGERSYGGDGGKAIEAGLNSPYDVAIAPNGSLYIADTYHGRIRRVTPDGIIDTVAGDGSIGTGGDGGPAIEAPLGGSVFGMALGGDGSFYAAAGIIRRISPNGFLSTLSSKTRGFSGDGGLITEADIYWPWGMAMGVDGSLYFSDSSNYRVRRVSPAGIVTTVAGNGEQSFNGDGIPATQAGLYPKGLAIDRNGTLYITDDNRIRAVSPYGIITTVAGNGAGAFRGDGGPATEAWIRDPSGVAIGPGGNLYIADRGNNRIRKVRSILPEASFDALIVSSGDGKQIYVFDPGGRHLRTTHALTGAVLYSFGYDVQGRLLSITDSGNNVTTIERSPATGQATAIIAADGQRSNLTFDTHGYLETVSNPAGETYRMGYSEGGLMTAFTTPGQHINRFAYDDVGRLTGDTNAISGGWTLARTENQRGYTMTMTSAEGRATEYVVEPQTTGDRLQVNRYPDGTEQTTLLKTNGETITTQTDGTVFTVKEGPDPRFGMQAPVTVAQTIALPSGLTLTSTSERAADLDATGQLVSQTKSVTVNGRTTTRHFDVASRTWTVTSPAGRVTSTVIDDRGRPRTITVAGLASAHYSYDTRGRLETTMLGEGDSARTTTLTYHASGPALGYVETVTDAENQVIRYAEYDLAGRVTQLTLPGERTVGFGYDANGNINRLTPPGRPAHVFTYNGVDFEASYIPPVLPDVTEPATGYDYNRDKQLELITRPGGFMIDYVYHATTGKLEAISTPQGSYGYTYRPDTGQLDTATAPGGEQLSYGYDGLLLTDMDWSGTISGTVDIGYDSDFRINALTVNGQSVSYGYDDDGLLTEAGALTLVRDPQHGLVSDTALGQITTKESYNQFGEVDSYTARYNDTVIYQINYDERDKLGRIRQKTEVVDGVTTVYQYDYDAAGRLDIVRKNGAMTADYDYDLNGNRTHSNGALVGSYDAQDRLASFRDATYRYTANGELDTVTVDSAVTDYDYDVFGNLRRVALPDGTIIDYVIDGQNRRIGKRVNGVLVQGFLYKDQLNPIAELDGRGAIVARFIYANELNVPAYMIKGGSTYRILSDHLGSPRLVVNVADGSITQGMDYDGWGNVLADTNPGFQPFGFAGGWYDRHTKLTRFGGRDYNAETGRWTAKDPMRFRSGDMNLFGYVAGDSINFIDPGGRILDRPESSKSIYEKMHKERAYNILKGEDKDPVMEAIEDNVAEAAKDAAEAAKEALDEADKKNPIDEREPMFWIEEPEIKIEPPVLEDDCK
ncbi:MAG: hypothetical protein MJE77_47605 [Proteobacteria bacterium]|nr:hypothetical protein [Pseudomonadota bacterium]